MKRVLGASIALSAVILTACAPSGFYEGIGQSHDDIRDHYAATVAKRQSGATYNNNPVAKGATVAIVREAGWLKTPVNARNAGGIPMQMIMESLGNSAGVKMIWSRDMDPTTEISGYIPSGTLKDALEWVSARTGYAYSVNDKKRTITWSAFITQSFNVSYLGGTYDYQIGSKGAGGSGGGGEGASDGSPIGSFAANEDSYSAVSGTDLDVFSDIEEAVSEVIGEQGTVAVSRSTGTAVVTATPAAMEKVERYFNAIEDILAQQIMLDVKIIRFSGDESSRAGINWDLVRDSGNDILSFAGTAPGQAGLGVAPVIINYATQAGSSALIELLNRFGDISIVTEPRVVTQSNRVVELELGNITGYLGESEVTSVSSNSNVLPAVDLEAAYVEDGYFLFALAKVGNNGNVVMHLASRFQDLLDIVRKEAGASAIETPSVSRNRFVQTVVMRNGSTLVLNALRQEVNESEGNSPGNARHTPTYKAGRSKIVETLVLVTPVILDMG